MDGRMIAGEKRQIERYRKEYITGRLNVQHMVRVRDGWMDAAIN